MQANMTGQTRVRRCAATLLAALFLPCCALGAPERVRDSAAIVISAPDGGNDWTETVPAGVPVWRSADEHAPSKLVVVTGEPASYTVELQRVSAVRCGNRFVDADLVPWKIGLAEAWLLPRERNEFIVSDDIRRNLENEAPQTALYTEEELRQVLSAGKGMAAQPIHGCKPAVWGERYVVKHAGKIEHELYLPHGGGLEVGKPSGMTTAMHLAQRIGFGKLGAYAADARPWPGDPTRIIAAYASLHGEGTEQEESYDLDLLIVEVASGKVLQRYFGQNIFVSDAMHFDSMWLDTANFAIKPGVRAFGVRSAAHHQGCAYSESESLDLFELQGNSMRRVLSEFGTRMTTSMCGGGESSSMKRAIAIAATSNHAYQDLKVSELVSGDNAICGGRACPQQRRRRNFLIRFDGEGYVVPNDLR